MKILAKIILGILLTTGLTLNAQNTESDAAMNALKKGDKAINFTLRNAKGEKVNLHKQLKKGPVILTWYRGGWCPYCNKALNQLQEYVPEINKRGATLIALTPELPDKSLTTSEKNELQFEILSDIDNEVGHKYNIVYKLSKTKAAAYEAGIGLSKYNGNKSGELPLPVAYVINTDGIITYSFVNEDFKQRADPEVLLKELDKLK